MNGFFARLAALFNKDRKKIFFFDYNQTMGYQSTFRAFKSTYKRDQVKVAVGVGSDYIIISIGTNIVHEWMLGMALQSHNIQTLPTVKGGGTLKLIETDNGFVRFEISGTSHSLGGNPVPASVSRDVLEELARLYREYRESYS